VKHLISIILPVYNAEKYIKEAVESVLNQTYQHWELLIINDGSTDNSENLLLNFQDHRIKYFTQENKGVSAARNVGLKKMEGDFFCFLDADDILTPTSLEKRVTHLDKNNTLDFVDGRVQYMNTSEKLLPKYYAPSYKGNPKKALLSLSSNCFQGPTWMVRRRNNIHYQFDENLKYTEDLFFYLSICDQMNGEYDAISDTILYYRSGNASAMSQLKGLEKGYQQFIKKVRTNINCSGVEFWKLKLKATKVMFLTHLLDRKNILAAFNVIPKYLFS